MTMADRIVVLNAGRVEQFGTPMQLYHHPATKFVASFIGQPNMNLIPAKVIGTGENLSVELDGGHKMALPVDAAGISKGDMVEVGIRPEHVTLGDSGLDISVHVLERLGGVSITYGTVGNGHRFCASLPGDAPVHEGRNLTLGVAPNDCHVFDANGDVLRRKSAPALVA
jgi:multiple sugar transport system ATP-binding protein